LTALEPEQLPRRWGRQSSLIQILQHLEPPSGDMEPLDLTRNAIDLPQSVLYALGRPAQYCTLTQAIPGRTLYRYERKDEESRGVKKILAVEADQFPRRSTTPVSSRSAELLYGTERADAHSADNGCGFDLRSVGRHATHGLCARSPPDPSDICKSQRR
jgi:hypothetical protein